MKQIKLDIKFGKPVDAPAKKTRNPAKAFVWEAGQITRKSSVMSRPLVLLTYGSWTAEICVRLARMGANTTVVQTMEKAREVYPNATHVLLPGGSDIDPAYYNQGRTHANHSNASRDSLEYWLAEAALWEGKPLFGICRGHQMITVVAGGELHQDIYCETGIKHGNLSHLVKVKPDSKLARLLKIDTTRVVVNSYHHQATSILPAGWNAVAASTDGVIEAIEHPDLPVISVQFHPEVMTTQPAINLFKSFLALK